MGFLQERSIRDFSLLAAFHQVELLAYMNIRIKTFKLYTLLPLANSCELNDSGTAYPILIQFVMPSPPNIHRCLPTPQSGHHETFDLNPSTTITTLLLRLLPTSEFADESSQAKASWPMARRLRRH
jgi:hypothetical protein